MGVLEGKVAIVTGAARGQGAEEARRFVDEGAQVMLTDIDPEGAAMATFIGIDRASFYQHDVASSADWDAVVAQTLERFGRIDILINNAAIYRTGKMVDTDEALFETVHRINELGVFLGMKAVAGPMAGSGGGSIVNISSGAGLGAVANMFAYAASKWAVTGMTKCAALELAKAHIRVNSVHPGVIDTPMLDQNPQAVNDAMVRNTPIGRIGTPGDVAELVLYLASDRSSFVTGATFAIDGGISL